MTIAELKERLENAKGADRSLDSDIYMFFRPAYEAYMALHATGDVEGHWFWMASREYTGSIDAAVNLCRHVLPGWGWRVATCCVSDDAWVFPDFNSPEHGERLKSEFSEAADWSEITDVDLRPPGRAAIALCISILKAKLAIETQS